MPKISSLRGREDLQHLAASRAKSLCMTRLKGKGGCLRLERQEDAGGVRGGGWVRDGRYADVCMYKHYKTTV